MDHGCRPTLLPGLAMGQPRRARLLFVSGANPIQGFIMLGIKGPTIRGGRK